MIKATLFKSYMGFAVIVKKRKPPVSSFCDIVIGVVFSENVIHEGDNHLEHAGTETSDGLESDLSWATECSRGCLLAAPVTATGAAYSGCLSKGGGSRCCPREPRSQAQAYHWRRSASASYCLSHRGV